MESSDYRERCLQCVEAMEAHNIAKFAFRSDKFLCLFNMTLESCIIAAAGYTGWQSYHRARAETSFIRALTSNSNLCRFFTPVPLGALMVVLSTGFFFFIDASRCAVLHRMQLMQARAAARAAEELERLKADQQAIGAKTE